MRPAADIARLIRAPRQRRWLALEAAWELMRARIDTALPAAHYTRHLGRLGPAPARGPRPADEALAAEIGRIVAATARAVPFRARCLQQALAVRRMLARRGVPTTVHLGLARGRADRTDPAGRAAEPAHAWVTAGGRVVSGDTDLARFVVIGTFS